jgi:hypothetical protein
MIAPTALLSFVVILRMTPLRIIITKCIDKNIALKNDISYYDKVFDFETDYDKENPITKKEGYFRILNLRKQ